MGLEFSQENIEESGKGASGTMADRCQGWACGGLCPVCFSAPWKEMGLSESL